jgi:hypothetical protein
VLPAATPSGASHDPALGADDPASWSTSRAIQKKETANALLKQLEYDQKSGRLLPADEVASIWNVHITDARKRLLTVPSRVGARIAHLSRAEVEVIDREIRDAITDLSGEAPSYVVLPAGASALPGPMRLFPYQRTIADAMSDPEIERITLVKASRIGFTALIVAAIGSYISNDPAQTLVVLPTESDCRDFCVSDLEPIFSSTQILRNALKVEAGEADRNTILSRRFVGGSLKIVPSRAPRSLRRHTARLLFIDEADACEQTVEGDPIKLVPHVIDFEFDS